MRSILGYIAAAFCVVVWGGTFVNTSELQVRDPWKNENLLTLLWHFRDGLILGKVLPICHYCHFRFLISNEGCVIY